MTNPFLDCGGVRLKREDDKMMENYLNILGEITTNSNLYPIYMYVGFSFVLATANIYSHLKARKESRKEANKLK